MTQENIYPTNHAQKVTKSLTRSIFVRQGGTLTTNDILGKFIAPLYPFYVIGFDGVRETKGGSSGTTTIGLYDSSDNLISALSFTYAAGDNQQRVGAIDTTYNYIDPGAGESMYIKVTANESTVGSGANLNIHYIFA